jgi:hypothetical protein
VRAYRTGVFKRTHRPVAVHRIDTTGWSSSARTVLKLVTARERPNAKSTRKDKQVVLEGQVLAAGHYKLREKVPLSLRLPALRQFGFRRFAQRREIVNDGQFRLV